MKVSVKRIITLIMCAVLLTASCLTGIAVNRQNGAEKPDITSIEKGAPLKLEGESSVAAQNGAYSLVCYKEPVSFAVVNTATSETVFTTSVSNDTYDVEGSSATWKNYMQAIAAVKYADKNEYKGTTIQDFSSAVNTDTELYSVKNGVWVDMYFNEPKIGFSFIVSLTGNALDVIVPESSIKEDGDYELLSIEIFPFMGAAPNNSDGYIVYPDGAGALTYFNVY